MAQHSSAAGSVVSSKPSRASRQGRGSKRLVSWVAGLLLLIAPKAWSEYSVALLSDGQPTRTVTTGVTFDLEVTLSSDTADRHDSAVLQIVFSASGLVLQDYQWSAPYATGGEDDISFPAHSTLPVAIEAKTATGSALPAEAVDLFLSNLISVPGSFGTGSILRLRLLAPATYVGPEDLILSLGEVTLAEGTTKVSAQAQEFRLRIRPATGSVQSPLHIKREGSRIELSWPAIIAQADLETSTDLRSSAWIPIVAVPSLVEDRYVVTLGIEAAAAPRFFRLRFR
jgi:hypothetical protein